MIRNRRYKYIVNRDDIAELYDLEADPGELKNLARDPQYREKLTELQGKVRQWQKRTGDPWESKWEYE
jgi:N-sulfoglucosamine sulfohydrolase